MSGEEVGILALQGDFQRHAEALAGAGLAVREIRTRAALEDLAAIVLPGGESTTMLRLLDVEGLSVPLRATLASGIPVLATCGGLILLAERVEPDQDSFGLLPVDVVRNGYGRQYHSGTFVLDSQLLPRDTTGVFIRAPRIVRVGPGAEILARWRGDPVLVQKGPMLAACFHPELEQDHPLTKIFADRVRATLSSP